MKNRAVALFVVIMLLAGAIALSMLTVKVFAISIAYTTTYADPADTPILGTMVGPSDYYSGDTRSGGGQSGSDAMPYGNALDQARVYIYDWSYPGDDPFVMLKWDMGFATNSVRVYTDCENAFQADGHDYLEYSLWGSNSPAENSGAWTLLWDPTAASSVMHTNDDLIVTAASGAVTSVTIYRYGISLDVGTVAGDAYSDAFTADFNLPASYRYFGIRTSTMAKNANDPDPEINTVATRTSTPLSVTISPMSISALMGQSVTFTSAVSGGHPPYSYQWYLDGAPVPGATSSSWTFTPTTSGIYYVYLKVTDANNNIAQSETARTMVEVLSVGGYSISLAKQTPTAHIAAYTTLITLFATAMSLTKRKRK